MNSNRNYLRQTGYIGKVIGLGITGGVCLAIGLFIGCKLDSCFSCHPWGIICGIIIGLSAAAVQTWKQLKESLQQFSDENERVKSKNQKM